MNHPDDFNDQKNTQNESDFNANSQPNSFFYSTGAYWYGVSYQDPEKVKEEQRKKRKKRIAVIALCAILGVLFLSMVGVVGYLVADQLSDTSGYTHGNTNTNVDLGANVYTNDGSNGYHYADVVISKNDGSTLQDSKNGSAGNDPKTMIEAIAAVKDSVVEIMTTTQSNYGTISAGAGSGVIIHADGIIVTNNHVIDGATNVYVRLTNGNTYEASVRGADEDGDIAIIKITPQEALTVAKLGYSSALALGEEVIAIGNPLGELGGTVTNGIISALEREIVVDGVTMTLIQTNAAINSGNSGGGLFNLSGELIGIVNAKYSAAGVEGLGFAIPVDSAIVSINHLLKLGYIPDIPALGVTVQEGNVQISIFQYQQVLYIYDAGNNTQFEKEDIILSVDGTSVSKLSELKRIIRSHNVGDEVTVIVLRKNTEVTLTVKLVEYIPAGASVDFD